MSTATAPAPHLPAAAPSRARHRLLVLAALVVLALAATLGVRAVMAHADDVRSGTEAVSAEQFASRTGAKITLLGVTGGGGMVELRYQVTDPDKASLLLHQEDKRPVLVVEDTGATLAMVSRPHNHKAELNLGGTYFFLMANTRNAIHDGTRVTVIVGDVRLEHVVAQA
ncbi:hypothetical protein KMZ32_16105 [Phycicoccus sp. MAQZ13P-2]|uniref:hypothetical protein n=1 Tax=Phycicoccus mangrovi TaxID=2840470 RepID=UPI001C007676|nr:hypothetical protein [Phycicoccus mangrovi]MBT9253985.1 hypothetical protein [Phycicoccus mangrovi]MBT9275602.1 hypothetical protein [Phycicoccus mangrovi]